MDERPTHCTTPTKAAYLTEEAAMSVLAKITANPRTDRIPTRAYYCRAGHWHLAGSTMAERVDRIEQARR